MTTKPLNEFYEAWSNKPQEMIAQDIASAMRKSRKIINGLEKNKKNTEIKTVLDFGCGYGCVLANIAKYLGADKAFGFDFSQAAISFAQTNYTNNGLKFYKLPDLEIENSLEFIKGQLGSTEKLDCVLLIDLLEHIPDCSSLIEKLAKISKYFIIKLPIEESFLDNHILPKQCPGPNHSNGHLREFNVNNVYHFVRELGLKPIHEEIYVYHRFDTVPLQMNKKLTSRFKYALLRWFKAVMAHLLPKRVFLRVIGGGGYWCIATKD